MNAGPLSAAFLEGVGVDGASPSPAFEARLARDLAAARAKRPTVEVDDLDFLRWLGGRLRTDPHPRYRASTVRVADLWLAYAVTAGADRGARSVLDAEWVANATGRLRRAKYADEVIERAIAAVRDRVDPLLDSYDAARDLSGWLGEHALNIAHRWRDEPLRSPAPHGPQPIDSWARLASERKREAAAARYWLDNVDGEGIVTYHQGVRAGGDLVFSFGFQCGTCPMLYERLADPGDWITDVEAVELLGSLDQLPDQKTLLRLARILEPGRYRPEIILGVPTRIEVGSEADIFVQEHLASPEFYSFEDPVVGPVVPLGTAYYRLPGVAPELRVLIPLHDPVLLDPHAVDRWTQRLNRGAPATAMALGHVDPRYGCTDGERKQAVTVVTALILDGHHRLAAAARCGTTMRVLAFFPADQ